MQATISRWGNSLALRLPRNVTEEAKLVEGSAVDVAVENGSITVTPTRKKYKLSDLLEGCSRSTETDWGKPEGDEVW